MSSDSDSEDVGLFGGFVYLIHDEKEPDDCLKLGMCKNVYGRRTDAYGSDCLIYARIAVRDPAACESKLKRRFKKRFNLYKGQEWFRGDRLLMHTLFMKTIIQMEQRHQTGEPEGFEDLDGPEPEQQEPEQPEPEAAIHAQFKLMQVSRVAVFHFIENLTKREFVDDYDTTDLYTLYQNWCKETSSNSLDQSTFFETITQKGSLMRRKKGYLFVRKR